MAWRRNCKPGESARLHGIGRIVVNVNLNVRTKGDFKVVEIEGLAASDDGGRAE